ncbi:hypothetical protein ASPFODRAFT_554636 [Aspergillus luchuensis CBS 106.47]|uniref:Uncharacterized protein n=1 Tax=Aspergillus luchuensis (strain CBS 106.47) TaxID=1137211 RepID=A0A1M3TQ53_ASPLC|nr:hypothetical protein ASPFODRAFT_554636 [Aspergillus luchuensis CBS 106.47]
MRSRFLDLEWIQHPISAYAPRGCLSACLCHAVIPRRLVKKAPCAVVHKYTFESVSISPFFLPRVECTLGNRRRLRNQIWEVIRPYMRNIDHADHRFQMFVWPRGERESDTTGRLGVLLYQGQTISILEGSWIQSVLLKTFLVASSTESILRTYVPCEKRLEDRV